MKSLLDRLRALLILGRVSNLPTVWSNLLAGWFLVGGGFDGPVLRPLLAGGSLLYVGGMYLNDYCDAEFDLHYCKERPIPSGKISRRAVGWLAVLWFIAGLVCLVPFGPNTAGIALLLLAAIVLYDFQHKNVAWAPLVMGLCRFLLYPLGASALVGQRILTGQLYALDDPPPPQSFELVILSGLLVVVPAALALGLYVAGITYLARGESRPGQPTRWALLLLLLPVAMAVGNRLLRYFSDHATSALSHLPLFYQPIPFIIILLVCLLQLYWMAWMLVPLWRKTNPSIGRVVSGLLAGIVLVDMIALAPQVGPLAVVLFPLFVLALLLQRVIPAT